MLKLILLVLALLPILLLYPIVATFIAKDAFYFSILWGPGSVGVASATVYVFTMCLISFLYTVYVVKHFKWRNLPFLLALFFQFLLLATTTDYPTIHRIYATTATLLSFLSTFISAYSVNPWFSLVMIIPLISGLVTLIFWVIIENDLGFSIGQLLLFSSIHYLLLLSLFIVEVRNFPLSPFKPRK